jgi:ABC-type siderophore export system fused ATPase/permease subunit
MDSVSMIVVLKVSTETGMLLVTQIMTVVNVKFVTKDVLSVMVLPTKIVLLVLMVTSVWITLKVKKLVELLAQ